MLCMYVCVCARAVTFRPPLRRLPLKVTFSRLVSDLSSDSEEQTPSVFDVKHHFRSCSVSIFPIYPIVHSFAVVQQVVMSKMVSR